MHGTLFGVTSNIRLYTSITKAGMFVFRVIKKKISTLKGPLTGDATESSYLVYTE